MKKISKREFPGKLPSGGRLENEVKPTLIPPLGEVPNGSNRGRSKEGSKLMYWVAKFTRNPPMDENPKTTPNMMKT